MRSFIDRLCLALTGQDALVVYHQLEAIYYNLTAFFLLLLGFSGFSWGPFCLLVFSLVFFSCILHI